MSLMEIYDEQEPSILAGVAPPPGAPPPSAFIIPWQGEEVWKHLLYCRDYVINNPEDTCSKFAYRNLLKAYASGIRH